MKKKKEESERQRPPARKLSRLELEADVVGGRPPISGCDQQSCPDFVDPSGS
jgi:hypothetical protein